MENLFEFLEIFDSVLSFSKVMEEGLLTPIIKVYNVLIVKIRVLKRKDQEKKEKGKRKGKNIYKGERGRIPWNKMKMVTYGCIYTMQMHDYFKCNYVHCLWPPRVVEYSLKSTTRGLHNHNTHIHFSNDKANHSQIALQMALAIIVSQ